MQQPTSLKRLEEIVDIFEKVISDPTCEEAEFFTNEEHFNETQGWLKYILNLLQNRKVYHKKRQLRWKMIQQVASEHLSEDELKSIDEQAEELVNKEFEKEDTSVGTPSVE